MKEKPKKSVRMWVARDKDNQLYLYRDKPTKGMASDTIVWLTTSFNTIHIDSDLFPSVKWEDKEPTRVTVRLAQYDSQEKHFKQYTHKYQ